MKRPSAFTLMDFLAIACVALVMTVLAVWAIAENGTGGLPVLLPAIVGWVLYVWAVHIRKEFLARYPHMTPHGILVNLGIAEGQWTMSDVILEVERSLKLTAAALGIELDKARQILSESHVYLTFQRGPIQHPQDRKVKVAGFITYRGQFMHVGVEPSMMLLSKTALAHEVGHVILGRFWDDWDQKRHHEFFKAHKLYDKE
jgi:hypothetical protein